MNQVIFAPALEQNKVVVQSQIAKMVPNVAMWKTSVTNLGWQCKWSMNGLMPTRPIVFITVDLELADGQLLILEKQ